MTPSYYISVRETYHGDYRYDLVKEQVTVSGERILECEAEVVGHFRSLREAETAQRKVEAT